VEFGTFGKMGEHKEGVDVPDFDKGANESVHKLFNSEGFELFQGHAVMLGIMFPEALQEHFRIGGEYGAIVIPGAFFENSCVDSGLCRIVCAEIQIQQVVKKLPDLAPRLPIAVSKMACNRAAPWALLHDDWIDFTTMQVVMRLVNPVLVKKQMMQAVLACFGKMYFPLNIPARTRLLSKAGECAFEEGG